MAAPKKMTNLHLEFNHKEHSDERLNSSISEILNKTFLLSMATTNDAESHINTAYFAFSRQLDFYFLSEIMSKHSQNVAENKSVALAIYDSHQHWGGEDRGLQVFGECHAAVGRETDKAVMLYSQRFPDFWKFFRKDGGLHKGASDFIPVSGSLKGTIVRFFVVRPKRLKLFDEVNFGVAPFIDLTVRSNSNAPTARASVSDDSE